jgi:hypothetical protein
VAPGDLAFKATIRSHQCPPSAEPEASIATVWAPNILSPGNFPYLRFFARHEVLLARGATCSEQKRLDVVSFESKLNSLLFETKMSLFSSPRPKQHRFKRARGNFPSQFLIVTRFETFHISELSALHIMFHDYL